MENTRYLLLGAATSPQLDGCPRRSCDSRYANFECDRRVAATCNAQDELRAYDANHRIGNECYVPTPVWEVNKERV
jgi:hypothetical protein